MNQKAVDLWRKFINKGNVLNYTSLLSTEEAEAYNKKTTALTDYQQQNLPNVIKGTMKWEDYVAGVQALEPDTVLEFLQKYVDLANVSSGN